MREATEAFRLSCNDGSSGSQVSTYKTFARAYYIYMRASLHWFWLNWWCCRYHKSPWEQLNKTVKVAHNWKEYFLVYFQIYFTIKFVSHFFVNWRMADKLFFKYLTTYRMYTLLILLILNKNLIKIDFAFLSEINIIIIDWLPSCGLKAHNNIYLYRWTFLIKNCLIWRKLI